MADDSKIKVFISWSGDHSRAVASALREWLPSLFDVIEPWMSDSDIAAGQRGLGEIESKLAHTRFGILVVTQANQHAAWLNFEAGALSKVVSTDTDQRVVPLLVDLDSPAQITGPLTQFQAKTLDKEGIRALLHSLGDVAGVARATIDDRVEMYWPKLERQVRDAQEAASAAGEPEPARRDPDDMLEEILGHVRVLRSESAQLRLRPTAPRVGRANELPIDYNLVRPNDDPWFSVFSKIGKSIGVAVLGVRQVGSENGGNRVVVAVESDVDDERIAAFKKEVHKVAALDVDVVQDQIFDFK